MQRIGCGLHSRKLLPSIPFGIRHSSTDSVHNNARTPKRAVRAPMTRLGDIVIPTREEVLAKSKRGQTRKTSVPFSDFYEPDVSYLNDASNNSLSAKLLRSLNDASARRALTEDEIAALTKKRRLDRLARETRNVEAHLSNYVAVPEKADILRSQLDKSSAFMSPERTQADIERGKAWAESRRMKAKHRISSKTDDAQEQRSGQRRTRRTQPAGPAARRSGDNRKMDGKRRARGAIQTQTLSTFDHQVDESIFTNGGHNPEFTGPEALSPTLVDHLPSCSGKGVVIIAESGKAIRVPISSVNSFAKGDFTPYLTAPAKDFGIPPDSLGAVKVAARTLTCQRQYSLPVRLKILDLVAKATKSLSKEVVKSA